MAVSAIGLKTHIWNNNAKSVMLLMGFPFLLLLMLFAFSAGIAPNEHMDYGMAGVRNFWPYVTGFAAIWFTIAWLFHEKMINKASGAKPLTRKENTRIYNMLENLCISRGITMPKLCIIESTALNAFASGISDKSYTITLTRGIIEALDDEELEAVIAHELTHIMNKDVRMLIIAVIFVGMISFFAEMAWRNMAYRTRRKDGRAMLVAAVVLGVGYLFAIAIRFTLSRKREYLADAGAVELTKNPDAMVRALMKISGRSKIEKMPDEVAQMCIENPPGFFSMFATHPPIDKRIDTLVKFAGATPPAPPAGVMNPEKDATAADIANNSPWAQSATQPKQPSSSFDMGEAYDPEKHGKL